jgi:uncharacterized membrane protein
MTKVPMNGMVAMGEQIKVFIQRLRNPSVVLSIVSQVITLLLLLNVNINADMITRVAAVVCSILITLGILSNPTTQVKHYGDDILHCSKCNKDTVHVRVNGKMTCTECGNSYEKMEAEKAT